MPPEGYRSLPTGVVTFLLTDMVGSTDLFRRIGEHRYGELLGTHHRLIRSALEASDGVEVGTEGDSFLAVFRTPADGARAALEAQSLLGAHPWPVDATVEVRMGLHVGTAQLTEDGTYVSFALHQVARVAAAARGGQVLATRALSDLGALPGARLRPIGAFWLKDFPEPVPLVAVVPPDSFEEPAAPRAPRADLSNLPTLRGLFLGRDEEIAEISALLDEPGLVTIIGPGGVGKTRLSLELAAHHAEQGGETWVVELAGVTTRQNRELASEVPLPDHATATAVVGAIARTLGTDAGTPEELARQLSTSTMLLVVDNAEHLLDAVAEVVDTLLARCPRLRLLVTSRQPLAVDSERLRRIEPLAIPGLESGPAEAESTPAVTLFATRARAADSTFALTPGNRDEVFELCRLLDGLPLALELAAARISILPPRALVERVRTVGDLPGLTGRARPNRHATLHAVLDWSLSMCSEIEISVLRRMAAFAGAVDLDAIAIVTGGESLGRDAVVDALAGLVDKSLVVMRRSDQPSAPASHAHTYDLLVTVRQAALSRLLAEDERDEAVARHASWVLDRVQEAAPLGLERDGAIIRAIALEIELSLERGASAEVPIDIYVATFLGLRDHFYSRAQHLGIRHGLHLAEQDVDPVTRAHCLYLASKAMLELLHPAFVSTTHAAVAAAREAGDPEALGRALLAIAEIELLSEPRLSTDARGTLEEAISWLERAAETSARSTLHLLLAKGFLALDAEDYATASDWYTKCLELTIAHGAEFSEAIAHFNIAEAAELVGDADRAVEEYRRAGETSIRLGGFISATDALLRATMRLTSIGDGDAAVECGAEAVLCARRSRSEPLLQSALEVYADAAVKAGDQHGAQHARNEAAAFAGPPSQTARAL
jgi:predicted ATPase/class 3 adenylate cyclase